MSAVVLADAVPVAASAAAAAVTIENVGREFGGPTNRITALDNVSLSVAGGQFVSLVGPSGCGKSTLLAIVAGLDAPTHGHVRLSGGQPAMVFQEAALFPWRTVLDNVSFGLQMRGMNKRERRERALDALRLVHLLRFAQAFPHELSGGMRQRAAIARALVLDPGVLLMDEPFGALDAQTRALLQAELLQVWERSRKTVLFVTHSLDEALALSDRIVLFSARPGRIIGDFAIDAPRPRDLSSSLLAGLRARLFALLSAEVEKVAAAEGDADWTEAGKRRPPSAAPEANVGADI